MAHQLPTNIFLIPMKNGDEGYVDVGPGKLSLIRPVTTKYEITREESTCLVTNHNATLDSGGGGSRNSQNLRKEVILIIPGVAMGLKFKVGDEMVVEEIVRKW